MIKFKSIKLNSVLFFNLHQRILRVWSYRKEGSIVFFWYDVAQARNMIKDPRHPFFYDTTSQYGDFNALWKSLYIAILWCLSLWRNECTQQTSSVYRPAFPEFEYCRGLLFSRIAVKIKKLCFFPPKLIYFLSVFNPTHARKSIFLSNLE